MSLAVDGPSITPTKTAHPSFELSSDPSAMFDDLLSNACHTHQVQEGGLGDGMAPTNDHRSPNPQGTFSQNTGIFERTNLHFAALPEPKPTDDPMDDEEELDPITLPEDMSPADDISEHSLTPLPSSPGIGPADDNSERSLSPISPVPISPPPRSAGMRSNRQPSSTKYWLIQHQSSQCTDQRREHARESQLI